MIWQRASGAGVSPADTDRLGADQVGALFSSLTLGVLAAAAAAVIVGVALVRLGALSWLSGLSWIGWIVACALVHIGLFAAYRQARPALSDWRRWAWWFTAIALAEGIGWGVLPVAVATVSNFDIEMLALVVMLGVAAGSIPAFSPFLPAFTAFFLPATLPYAVWSAAATGSMHRATTVLMILFVGAIFALGVTSNRSFKKLVRLRIMTADLAESLSHQKEVAEAANLSKSTFLAAASHDLRQPVHAVGLFVGALRGVPMAPEGKRLVEQIEASTNAMDGLFTALLDISRLDAGIVEVHRRVFAIAPFLDRICRDHAGEAAEKGIGLTLQPSSMLVLSDPVLMERILRNLVSNAVRYTDCGRVLVGCRRRGGMVVVQVWDTGRGIPADQQDKIFQEYYQLGNSERDRARGLGLGLAIVRRLTDLLGSTLTLRSEPGQGSCFEVAIPRADPATTQGEEVDGVYEGTLVRGLVIVVDDEQAIRDGMATLLTGWGYDVISAASGEEAMGRLAGHPVQPGLIICDYRLRENERGIEVVEGLRAEYNEDIPAMLITGDTAPDRLREARASGLLLLHKPVSNSKLRAAVVNLTSRPLQTAESLGPAI